MSCTHIFNWIKTVFSPVWIKGIILWMHILGGANVHIKAIGSTPIPHQSKTNTEGIWGQYLLSMLGRTLQDGLTLWMQRFAFGCIECTCCSATMYIIIGNLWHMKKTWHIVAMQCKVLHCILIPPSYNNYYASRHSLKEILRHQLAQQS